MRCACSFNKNFPNLSPSVLAQVVVFKHEVNPAEDCYIKMRYPVRREEYDSFAVFQFAEKHKDKIAMGMDREVLNRVNLPYRVTLRLPKNKFDSSEQTNELKMKDHAC